MTQVLDVVRGLHQLVTFEQLAASVAALLLRVTGGGAAGLLLPDGSGGWRATDGRERMCAPATEALPALRRGGPVLDRLVGLRTPSGGPASTLHLPLVRDGQLHGLLAVQWDQPVTATGDTLVQVLDVVAHEVGYALTELQARALLRVEAETDPLTGVANRRRGNAQLRTWPDAVIALVDLDHFKRVNDALGHAAGDEVLRRFAVALVRHARAGDLVCRWGGEEFLIALPHGDERVLAELLDRVRDDVTGDLTRIDFSAGVTQRHPGERLADCLARVDTAMYDAKRGGRGRTHTATAPGRAA